MRISLSFLGAATVIGMAGAISGAYIGTSPMIIERGAEAGLVPESAHAGTKLAMTPPMPDHYALETPDGRYEVGELALRGRLRGSPVAVQWAHDSDLEDRFASRLASEESDARLAREAALIAYTARPMAQDGPLETSAEASTQVPMLSRAEAPLALADPVAIPAAGSARMVNVEATLAARQTF